MRAMLLAAGRGKRLRPYTDHTPKPLLPVAGMPLIERHVRALAAAGFKQLVINHAHLGEQIEAHLGDGSAFGLSIEYSPEPPGGLETGGGLRRALPLLGSEPFAAINADILTDFDFAKLGQIAPQTAHWVMVTNPPHNPDGDFRINNGKLAALSPNDESHTFSGIAVYQPDFIASEAEGFWSITELIRQHLDEATIEASLHCGYWSDVGTPQRWQDAERDWPATR